VVFPFFPHFPFLFVESDPESLYAQRIHDTPHFPTPTTEAVFLTVIDVCSLKATIFARFFGAMSIFTLAKTNLSQGSKSSRTCERHKLSSDEAATFPVKAGLQTSSY
jgi:hypothetical protein